MEDRVLLAATITVNSTSDTDNPNDGLLTLREAILIADGTRPVGVSETGQVVGTLGTGAADRDGIAFNIPGAGVRTINLISALPTVTDPVTIDGYTQPGASPNTLAGGDDAVLLIELNRAALAINGLTITAGNSTVRGLVINGNINTVAHGIEVTSNGGDLIEGNFIGPNATGTAVAGTQGNGVFINGAGNNTIGGTISGARNVIAGNSTGSILILGGLASGNLVQGNFLGTDVTGTVRLSPNEDGNVSILGAPNNTIGGTAAGARNVMTASSNALGIRDSGASGNLVQGNFIGINVTGTAPLGSTGGAGVAIGASSSSTTIGGTAVGARNVISGNPGGGIAIVGFAEMDTLVQGNYIGTDASGVVAVPNGGPGVQVGPAGPSGATIGGTTPEARNIISGNNGSGIVLEDASQILVQGDFIGVNVNRDPLGDAGEGVFIDLAGATIGATTAAAGNVIAFNGQSGVRVSGLVGSPLNINNRIESNSIFANGGLGINLGNDGVTANDSSGHVGPNNLQNFPVITAVSSAGSRTTVAGTLNSTPTTTFRLEFFASDAADASSFGEGQVVLGSTNVTTDAAGNARFNATLPAATAPSQFITATATDPAGNTSEFSQLVADLAVAETSSPAQAAIGQDLVFTVTVTNPGPFPGANVVLTDTLPSGVTFVSATGGATPVGGVLTLNLGTLAAGARNTVTIVLRSNVTGTVTNSVTATTTVTDPDSASNTASATISVTRAAATADLSVVVTDAPDPVTVGHDLTYTIVVMNAGPDPATGVVLTQALPSGATFVSATGGALPVGDLLTFDLGTLAVAAAATVTIVVTPRAPGAITGTAAVTGNRADPNAANNQTPLVTTSVAPSSGDTTAPTVVSLQRFGYHTDRTFLVVTYSEPVDIARALDRANYTVRGLGRDGRFGTPDDPIFPIESLRFGPAPNSVVLLMKSRLYAYVPYQLTVNGTTPGAVADVAANRLDGNQDGRAGGNFVRRFGLNIIAGTARDLRTSHITLSRGRLQGAWSTARRLAVSVNSAFRPRWQFPRQVSHADHT
jgi:uncharacterized repeat protein (TIGR01451 family)/CSLREA domain-containing protein